MTVHTDHNASDYRAVVCIDTQLVDVREPEEFAAGTLPGAINIPLGQLAERTAELDSSRRVVLLCRSGRRSAEAAQFLTDIGFPDVVNLAGGILAFAESTQGVHQ